MNKPLPEITETEQELKELINKSKDYRIRQRLQALYLLSSSQAKTRIEVSRILGVHRDTVGRWVSSYFEGGMDKLIDIHHPQGRTSSIPKHYKEQLRERLSTAQGVRGGYKELWLELRERYRVKITYQALYQYVRHKLKAKLKVPRKSHIKKPF